MSSTRTQLTSFTWSVADLLRGDCEAGAEVRVHSTPADGAYVDERTREVQECESLLFDKFARERDAKEASRRTVEAGEHRPDFLDD